jgi:hypothetical protein
VTFPKSKVPAQILWSNFKRDISAWQGALKHKETYMRAFLSQSADTIKKIGYNTSKLEVVLSAIFREAVALSAAARGSQGR